MQKSYNEVKEFWEKSATREVDDQNLRPTARDPYLQQIIEEIMFRYLSARRHSDQLLDVGCGDGVSTLRFVDLFRRVVGVDYVEQFVARAAAYAESKQFGNVHFQACDATDLRPVRERYGLFDVVVSIRCLINLATSENQKRAIREIAATIKPGGLYVLSEGWKEGMDGLNKAREAAGLDAISVVPYNLLIERSAFEAEIAPYFTLERYESLGLYIYFSRVAQPILVSPCAPRHDHPLNSVGMQLTVRANRPGFDDCDYAGVYILRRK